MCRQPQERSFVTFFLYEHSFSRLKYIRKGDASGPVERIGLLIGSAVISLFIIFAFTHTSATCKQQEDCIAGCKEEVLSCKSTLLDPWTATQKVYIYPRSVTPAFLKCRELAVEWDRQHTTNDTAGLVCSLQANQSLLCVDPLNGKSCDDDQQYNRVLTGTASIPAVFAFLLIPQGVDLIYGLCIARCFNCCLKHALKGRILFIGLLGLLCLLLFIGIVSFARMDTYFLPVRIGVWALSFLGAALLIEPAWIACKWAVLGRCGRATVDAHQELQDEDIELEEASSDASGSVGDVNRVSMSEDLVISPEEDDRDNLDNSQ